MTVEETLKIFAVLKANYSNFYKTITRADAEAQVNLWAEMFADDGYSIAGAAVKAYIANDESGYPPNVGEIKSYIRKLTHPEVKTEQEAISLIMKATTNSLYNSNAEFEKLPPILQRLVGSPNQLREWALMDIDTVKSVVASNLMRSYKVLDENEKQKQALPLSLQNMIAQTASGLSIEGAKE